MRVVVTGAAGFLGRSVSSRLEEQGNEVIRVARTPGNLRASERASALYLDLRRPDVFKHSLPSNLDTIVHLAAAIPTSFTGTDANNAAQANIAIDRNVFLACRDLGVATIYASGTSVYGLGNSGPHVESAPTSAVGPYVAAKIAGEHAGKELLQARGIPFTVLRISAPYGPGQQARTVLRLFIERGLQDLPLQYHGTGSRQQDFTYVADVVDAVAKACRIQPRGIYNIASGRPISMRQLAELVKRCLPHCNSRVEPSGQNDPQERATAGYSIKEAERVLQWQPQYSLEAGIKAWIENWTA